MRHVTKATGSFLAKHSSGKRYRINIFTDFIQGENSDGTLEVTGLKSLRLDDGSHVNRLGKGRYSILSAFGEIEVTSDEPNAP